MDIEELKKIKEENGITNQKLSEMTGVSYSTITKIFSGATKSPRADKIKAIENSLSRFLKDEEGSINFARMVNRLHTADEYFNLPEEKRVELIDGVFYDLSSPTVWHQRVVGNIYAAILIYIKGKKGGCVPIVSPIDVQLDCDDSTVVQPDVVVVCDKDKIKENIIYGAPDWVIEVVSKSTKNRDYITKLKKYTSAGVKEYWIIDPIQGRVMVYTNLDNEEEMMVTLYTLADKIPVGLYDDLIIDMRDITAI